MKNKRWKWIIKKIKIKGLIKENEKRAPLGTKMRYFKIPLCRNFVWKVSDYSASDDTCQWCLRSKIGVWHLARTSNAQAQLQETSYAHEHNQETFMLKHNCKRLLIKQNYKEIMFDVEHLIYNQWCSQYKSDTDS